MNISRKTVHDEVFLKFWQKGHFLLNIGGTHFFFFNALLVKKKCYNRKYFWGLIQAPNTSKYITRNKVATMKDSRKTAHKNV